MERGRNGKDDYTEKADDRADTEGRYLRHPDLASSRLLLTEDHGSLSLRVIRLP
jgi:hypothetical protein